MATSIPITPTTAVTPTQGIEPVTPSYIEINGSYFAVTAFLGDTQVSMPSASVAIRVAKLFEEHLPRISKITCSVERKDGGLITTPLPSFDEANTCFESSMTDSAEYVIQHRTTVITKKRTCVPNGYEELSDVSRKLFLESELICKDLDKYKKELRSITDESSLAFEGNSVESAQARTPSSFDDEGIEWQQARTPTPSERGGTPLPTVQETIRRANESLSKADQLFIRDEELKRETEKVLRSRPARDLQGVFDGSQMPSSEFSRSNDSRSLSPEVLASVFDGEGEQYNSMYSTLLTADKELSSAIQRVQQFQTTRELSHVTVDSLRQLELRLTVLHEEIKQASRHSYNSDSIFQLLQRVLDLDKELVVLTGEGYSLEKGGELVRQSPTLTAENLEQPQAGLSSLPSRSPTITSLPYLEEDEETIERAFWLARGLNEPVTHSDSDLLERANGNLLALRQTIAAAEQTLDRRSSLLQHGENQIGSTQPLALNSHLERRPITSPRRHLTRDDHSDRSGTPIQHSYQAKVLHVRSDVGNPVPSVTAYVREPDQGESSDDSSERSEGTLVYLTPERRQEEAQSRRFFSLANYQVSPTIGEQGVVSNDMGQGGREQTTSRSSSLGREGGRGSQEAVGVNWVEVSSRSPSPSSLRNRNEEAEQVRIVVNPQTPVPSPHSEIGVADGTRVNSRSSSSSSSEEDVLRVGFQGRRISSPMPGSSPSSPTTGIRFERNLFGNSQTKVNQRDCDVLSVVVKNCSVQ